MSVQTIPKYVLDRIQQHPIPFDLCVRPDCAPVISDGDPSKARIATIGINPSGKGGGLPGASLSPEDVVNHCNEYFRRRVYRWFISLEEMLNELGFTYYGGSACHLDLVKWSTEPVWSELCTSVRYTLLEADRDFFARQVNENENIGLLLATNLTVIRELECLHNAIVAEERKGKHRVFYGEVYGRHLFGWNIDVHYSSQMKQIIVESLKAGG